MVTRHDIDAARERIAGRVHRTPLFTSEALARRTGIAHLALKCENLQKTGSFKVRGALNLLSQLSDDAKKRGVVSVSAGNHAQAIAWGAAAADVKCTVVMPAAASQAKVDASRGYGANIILHGTGAEAFAKAFELSESEGFTFVHPFDDDRIIAGAGTAGTELLEQCETVPDIVVVPIGGGGLISGIAVAIKENSPGTRVIGVEPTGAAVMRQSLDAGHATRMTAMSTLADGLAAPMAGERNFAIVQKYVDDVVLVTDDEIADAMRALMQRCKLVTEPAGAASMAAILNRRFPMKARDRVVALVSGGNVDLERLKTLI